ncbi:MAG TPA: hypothetical protein VIO38_16130 [Rariglobus sp.]
MKNLNHSLSINSIGSIAVSVAFVLLAAAGCPLNAAEQFNATVAEPLVIEDPAALSPGDTIAWVEQDASVRVNASIDQSFVDRFVPLADPVTRGYLNVRSGISSDLDFTGKGDISLAGRNGFNVAFSGSWTPGATAYRVSLGELTLSGINQLTDVDGSTSRQLVVENASLTITGAQAFTGGVTLTSNGTGSSGRLTLGEAASAGASGSITMLDDGTTAPVLTLGFAADQTFIDRVSAPTGEGERAIIQLSVNNSNALNFSGVGNVSLGGTASSVVYAGAWTPGGDQVYRVSSGAITLGGVDQLTDADGSTPRSLEVEGAILKMTGAHSYSGGTVLKSGAMVAAGVVGSLGTGGVVMENGSRLQAGFAVDQTFIDRISGPDAGGETAVLQLGVSTNADLDFTGRGQVALAGGTFSEGGTTLGGSWTPSGDVYQVAGQPMNSVFTTDNWNGLEQAYLTLTRINALSDGLAARSLEVGDGAYLDLQAANSYTGGTQIRGDYYVNNTSVAVGATGALGSGAVTVDTASLVVYGEGVELNNTVTLSAAGESGHTGGVLVVQAGANVTGQVNMLRTDLSRATYDSLPAVALLGGEFSGQLNAQGPGNLQLSAGVFSGTLTLASGADVRVLLNSDVRVTSAWTITHGNTLVIEGHSDQTYDHIQGADSATGGGFYADLTLQSGAVVQLAGFGVSTLYFGGEGIDVALGNAWFDIAGSLGGFEDWSMISGETTGEYMIMAMGAFQDGQITGTLRGKNMVDGYDVTFELRNGSRELWAVVSARSIPEPSTCAAIVGAVVLAGAVVARRTPGGIPRRPARPC